jgi:hypothetical protein
LNQDGIGIDGGQDISNNVSGHHGFYGIAFTGVGLANQNVITGNPVGLKGTFGLPNNTISYSGNIFKNNGM